MRLDELFDPELGYDEDMDGIYLVLKTVPSDTEIFAYYNACNHDFDCLYNRLITYNRGWKLIEQIKGRTFARKLLKKILKDE